jgi:hypothetical protein
VMLRKSILRYSGDCGNRDSRLKPSILCVGTDSYGLHVNCF